MTTVARASPFSSATAVVSEEFVATFPQPRAVLTDLCRLCFKLGVDIVSLERPVTVKGSWRSIIKVDAFLKTFIASSALHSDISEEGSSAEEEEEFCASLDYVEEKNNSRNEAVVTRHTTTTQPFLDSNDLSDLKADDFLHVIKTDEENSDCAVLDKWYFNSNPRGKTVMDNKRRAYYNSGKTLPEPYVIVEADDANKVKNTSMVEIERVLSQVYKKETIEKYQHKSYCSDKQSQQTAVLDEVDSPNEPVASDFSDYKHTVEPEPLNEHLDEERKFNVLTEEIVHSLRCVKDVILDDESERLLPKSYGNREKKINNMYGLDRSDSVSNSPVPRRSTRQTNSLSKKTNELINRSLTVHKKQLINRSLTVHKKQKEHRRGRKKRKNDKTNIEDVPQATNHKAPKANTSTKERIHQSTWQSPRRERIHQSTWQSPRHERIHQSTWQSPRRERIHQSTWQSPRRESKATTKDTDHQVNQKATQNLSKLQKEVNKVIEQDGPQATNHKAPSKAHRRIKERIHQSTWQSPRHKSKATTEGTSRQVDLKATSNVSKLQKEVVIEQNETLLATVKTEAKTSFKGCKYVGKKSKETRNRHKRETVLYNCDQCSYLATKQLQLSEHKRRVHLTKKFRCEECLKEFGFRKDLRRHMKCHKQADNCCDVCGKMYKDVRKMIEHKRTHADNYVKPEFPCKFCAKKFSTKYVLAYHIKSNHLGMKRTYVCPTCGKSFSQKNSYVQHANVHLGIRPFTCEVCGKTFSYERTLKEHGFMHNEQKVFSCSLCNKSFRQASGLSIHLKVHKTTKDYVCSMCGKGFTQKQALVRHERIHGGDKPYECGLCKRTFSDSSVLRRHMILIHKREPKLWRQDTLFRIPRRSDFFISVINGDSLLSKDADIEKADKTCSQQVEQNHQNICWQHENKQKNQYEQRQPHNIETIIPGRFNNGMIDNTKSPSTAHRKPDNTKSSSTAIREPVIIEVTADYMDTSYADVKPYTGYVLEKDVTNDGIITSIAAATNQYIDTELFSSSALHNHSTLPIHSSITIPTNCMRSVVAHHHHQPPLADHPSQSQPPPAPDSSSFVPVTYQQRPGSYDSCNMQAVPYSTMMVQPYSHTILVHQDSFGTITYHQPEINSSFSHENHHQYISPSVTLSSSPGPHVMDISKSVTSVSSEHMYG